MPNYSDINSVKLQLSDGSVWQAHVDSNGTLIFDKQLAPPPPQQGQTQQSPPDTQALQDMLNKLPGKGTDNSGKKEQNKNTSGSSTPPMDDKVFRARLASIMLDNKYDRRLKGRTRGKLDMKALYKVPTLARSIFTQKTARKNKEYNIVFVVDRSGSMDDMDGRNKRKSDYATEACTFLVKSFEGININTAIVGFDDDISVLKEFASKPDYNKIKNGLVANGATATYVAMNRGYKMFDNKNTKNIMMLLTDGEAGNRAGNTYYDLKGNREDGIKYEKTIKVPSREMGYKEHLYALVRSHKDITTIGVGIKSDCSAVVPNNIKIDNLEDLKPKIINILKKQIKRG